MKNKLKKEGQISDQNLYKLCKLYGQRALEARRKFAGLLPEVYKRRLFERKGFGSIYEFAAKLAGMSREQVDRVLQLEKRFVRMPVLREALVEGEVSANKLARVACLADKGNQGEILEKVKILPNRALEVWVKDVKNETTNTYSKTLFEVKSVHVHRLDLDSDIENELIEMQEKGIDVNEFLREALRKRREEIENEKAEVAVAEMRKKSRYIPTKTRKLIRKEHGNKCSMPDCKREARVIHHKLPFSLGNSHDPHFLTPLCEEHHKIAHLINVKYAEMRE